MVEMKEGRKGGIPVAAEAAGSVLGVGSGRFGMVLRTGISAETDRQTQTNEDQQFQEELSWSHLRPPAELLHSAAL